jgi:hypothetical protein
MIRSRAEDRPRTIGRGPSGRCGAQIAQAWISATSRLKAGSKISPLGSRGRRAGMGAGRRNRGLQVGPFVRRNLITVLNLSADAGESKTHACERRA